MLAAAELADGRRWRSTFWMSLSLAFKPLTVVMILLVAALDRRMAWRLFVGVALVLLFPFLTQTPHYVADQYVKSLQMFRASSLCGMTELWAQPFSALSLVGITVTESVQTLIRAAAALATLALCWVAQRRHGSRRAVEYLFAFSVLYILLFNPRTENNTYAMLGPAIGLFAAPWIGNGRHRAAVLFLSLLLFLLAAGDELVRVVAPPGEHIWLKPSQGILFLLYLVRHLFFPDGDPRQRSRFDSEPASEVAGRPVLAGAGTTERRGPFFS
jgi:alpha-1,2-mannosyltransferase